MAVASLLELLSPGNTSMVPPVTYTTAATNTTSAHEIIKPYPEYVGYIAALVAIVMYGSNFVPIKKFYTGDGEQFFFSDFFVFISQFLFLC